MSKIILDLCGGTGSWSRPYKETGYDIRLVTFPEQDIRTYKPQGNVYGILAAPPCTMFSLARTKAKKPRNLKEGMEIVRACLDIIWSCMEVKQDTRKKTVPLKFWALENPNGMLKYFLGKPALEFHPWEYGDTYQKKTHIWGWFNEPKKLYTDKREVSTDEQIEKHNKSLNPTLQKKFDKLASREIAPEMFGKFTRQERRAITPKGFAEAFFKVNK